MDLDNPSHQPVPAAWDSPILPLVTKMEITRDMLVQRGKAGCFDCGRAAQSLELKIFESQTIPSSANPSVNGEQAMHFKSMQASLGSAKSALRACSQCGPFPRVETSALLSGAAIVQKPKKIGSAGQERAKQVEQMLGNLRAQSTTGILLPIRDISRFTRPKTTFQTARGIFLNLAMNMTQGTTNEKFIFACLWRVLDWIGEPVRELKGKDRGRKSALKAKFIHYARGVIWANKLLEELYWCGWGHQAFELLLFWNKSVHCYASFADERELQKRFVNELSKPEWINLFPPVPGRVYKSLPILIHATLRNTVSYHQICEALGYEREYVDATKDELLPTIFTLSTPQGIDASNPSTYDGEMSLSEGNWDVGSACNTLTVPDAWSGEASSDFDKTANVDQSTWDKYEDNPGVKVHGWLGRYSALSGASLDGMWLTG